MALTVSYHPQEFITENGFDAPLISIKSPKAEPFIYHPAWNQSKILKLEFDDIDYFHMHKDLTKYNFKLFDFEMGEKVLDVIYTAKINNEHVYINCEAGFSRSAGIAHYMFDKMDFKLLNGSDFYNRYVYDILHLICCRQKGLLWLVKEKRIDTFQWFIKNHNDDILFKDEGGGDSD
jgi:hypothetical protein